MDIHLKHEIIFAATVCYFKLAAVEAESHCVVCLGPSDGAHHPSAALLPAHLEALGVFPLPRHHDRHLGRGALRFRGDGGELLLHPQHLAHADRGQRGLPPAAARQARRQGDPAEAPAGLRLSAVRERARGAGPGGPRHHLHQQHLHQLMTSQPFTLETLHCLLLLGKIHTREIKPQNLNKQNVNT